MRTTYTVLAALALSGTELAAQQQVSTAAPPTPKQLGMVVYPAQKQSPEQQAADEAACMQWAQTQTGINLSGPGADPTAAGAAAKQQAAEATQGAAVVGAAKGAAAGVAIGAIAGDAGTGAAIGAVGGAIAGRRAKKQAEAQAQQAGAQQAQAQNKAMVDQVKKAVGACLQGRGYTVS